jgi:processive 1,2-diacylglycerol beta-glucosyltransferase
MRDYALISDLVCSKCGWLTISEALALQRPMALYDAIPGHETQNARYIMHNGLGLYEPNPTKIARRIEHAIANADTLAAYKDTMRRAHSASSPYPEITRLLAAYLDMSPRNTV